MERDHVIIEIGGAELPALYPDLLAVEVELDDELAAMVRLRIALLQRPDGTWPYLDDEAIAPWKPVTVTAGFETGAVELLAGYLTHVRPCFDPDPGRPVLEVWGMDGSVRLDRAEKLRDWPGKTDSEIAAAIFDEHGLTPEVEDTTVTHEEAVSTVIQRETDAQFLKRLALRNGYECFVEGRTGYFRAPRVGASAQPVLAVHFGEATTVRRLSLELNALTPASVAMFQVDRVEKQVLEASVVASARTALGRTPAAGLLGPGIDPGQVYVAMNVTSGAPEMLALCRGLYHEAEWFVTGEGEIDGHRYGHVLKPRGTVTIKGVGETHSGVYHVTHVTHTFTAEGYTQAFRVKRNAIRPTGAERFAAAPGLPGGLG
jgi:phage protein D